MAPVVNAGSAVAPREPGRSLTVAVLIHPSRERKRPVGGACACAFTNPALALGARMGWRDYLSRMASACAVLQRLASASPSQGHLAWC